MLRKVLRVGNSAAITIPKDFLKEARIKIGDLLSVEPDLASKTLLVKPKKTKKTSPISQELISWTDKFIKKYQPFLEELAKQGKLPSP